MESLEALGESTTYRTLLATVASRVGRSAADQHPELHPLDWGGPGDELFLDGAIPPVQSTFTVTRSSAGLTVDAGLVHGMRPPVGDEAFVLACTAPDGTHAGMVRIAEVSTGDSTVEPIEWTPLDVAYAAVVAEVPLPPAEVAFDQPIPLIADAIASCGPSGGPSPHVRVADENRAAPGVRFRVRSSDVGIARIARPDGSPLTDDIAVDNPAGALLAVRRLEHFSRWETIRGLGNHPSPLRESVALEVFDAIEGETTRPDDRHARPAAAFYHLEYRRDDDGRFLPPLVFLEINNTTSNDLFVAVLDLTDRFKCSAVVPTCKLAAGQSVSVGGSAPIPIHLPPGRSVEPGAKVRDWLKLIVSNAEFDASAFDLPALDDPAPDRPRGSRATRWGTIERIAARAVSRDFGGEPPPTVAHWAASTFEFETVVP